MLFKSRHLFILFFCTSITAQSPEFDTLFNIGIEYFEKEEFEKAIKYFSKAYEVESLDILDHYLGLSFLASGELDSAEEYLLKTVKDTILYWPSLDIFYYNLACLYSRKNNHVS